ncbi:disks large-associated protein 5 [Gadus chalcogrammus]|uniref:disks large-associated protein 5 n=1 Tax=Gadus chalcogrammus TaxID=1042646 RepID=UPI0024C4B075|nr:disks large-associated protein 5 [Gadus chalcogrammus]
MESRFATLRQRDSSVSMLRVKMSRRLSHSQKENRGKMVNSRRQIEKLSEMDQSSIMDASAVTRNMSVIQEKFDNVLKTAKTEAGLDRLKQLERWKERKTLEKEKSKREKELKDVFKTGVYHPKDTFNCVALPPVPKSKARPKEAVVNVSLPSRVTRSGKRQPQPQKSLPPQKEPEVVPAVKKVEPSVGRTTRSRVAGTQPAPASTRVKATVAPVGRAMSTRSARGPPVASVPKAKDKHTADASLINGTRKILKKAEVLSGKASTNKVTSEEQPILPKESDPGQEAGPPTNIPTEEDEERVLKDVQAGPPPVEAPATFAPQGFLFQAPVGLSSFKFEPLTPRSADSFLRPSPSFNFPPVPAFHLEPQAEQSSFLPLHSPPRTSPALAPRPDHISPQAPVHDVPYFRLQMVLETDKLTGLSALWEPRVQDETIPEEMRNSMRTVVGQARLLVKERFGQFRGLVDDCELGRGERITSCMDLEGFWEMVYYQVVDVEKKFAALKEAEANNWVEELKPAAPRPKKVIKKPPTAAPSAPKPAAAIAAGRSRLAAAKAAMKAAMLAKKQAAEAASATQSAGNADEVEEALPREAKPPAAEPLGPDTVLFHGGFFQVESPAKLPGSTRKSLRLSCAVQPRVSPQHFMLKCATPTRATNSTPTRATNSTPARATNSTPARATNSTPARATNSTPARATNSTPARATNCSPTPARDAITTPAKDDTTTQARATRASSRATPARATTTPARDNATPARDTTTTPARETPARATKATPARASTTPARASTTPARASTTPARASTTPARASTTPARASTTPARASTTPARASTTPARASTTPARASTTPARATTTPARATPGRTTTTPARVTRRSQFTSCSTPSDIPPSSPPGVQSQDEPLEANVVASAPQTPASAPQTPASAPQTPASAPQTPASAPQTPASAPQTPASAPPSPASHVLEARSLSFSLSPCSGHSTPGVATDPSHPSLPFLQKIHIEGQESICDTPDNSVLENVPGLDFERYLRPSEGCSPPPGPVAMETLSPKAVAMEMGSPMAEDGSGDLLPQEEALSTPAGLHAVSSNLAPHDKQAQPDLLLFTPDHRDRIRASMCPRDLMVFTPPEA